MLRRARHLGTSLVLGALALALLVGSTAVAGHAPTRTPEAAAPTVRADPSAEAGRDLSTTTTSARSSDGFLDTADLAFVVSEYRAQRGLGPVRADPRLEKDLTAPPAGTQGATPGPTPGSRVLSVAPASASMLSAALATNPSLAEALSSPSLVGVAASLPEDRSSLVIGLLDDGSATSPTIDPTGAASASTDAPVSALDEEASVRSLGPATGAVRTVSPGVQARSHARGVVVETPVYGAVAMSTPVFENWSAHPLTHGLPVRSEMHGEGLETRFELDRVREDPDLHEVVRTDLTLGPDDVLTIGDSQVWDGSWIGRGLEMNGLDPVFYHRGGIGYVNTARSTYGTYHQGVVENYWALPVGSPGYIYVGGSGNDANVNDDAQVRRQAAEVIRELKRRYPDAVIVMGGVVSTDRPDATRRWAMDDLLGEVARQEKVSFLSLKGWTSLHQADGLLVDGLHFSVPRGQETMAPYFRDGFRRVIDD